MVGKRSMVRKGVVLSLIVALVMTVMLATGWAGMHYPENLSAFNRWMGSYQSLWLLWRLSLYGGLLWGGRKVWLLTKNKPAYRAPLKRMMTASVLFILLCEYTLSGGMEALA
ncbi:hypothetical protein ABLB84_03785 [Xenorhabdus szentirmaii]|uniref:hypothetical protein n=1 Tax=Xenorhabdus szentirmaii TaxID=290112 RepID=UPI0032B78AAF